jgi:hypothetical protein
MRRLTDPVKETWAQMSVDSIVAPPKQYMMAFIVLSWPFVDHGCDERCERSKANAQKIKNISPSFIPSLCLIFLSDSI